MIYENEKTKQISFPLGGIGTGCIGLAGNGELKDWEIFNKPNKNTRNAYSHFALKATCHGESALKVLQGDPVENLMGGLLRVHRSLRLWIRSPSKHSCGISSL